MTSDESNAGTPHPSGPRYRCRNGDCEMMKPATTVHESERKTLYRCPGCSRALHVDWNDEVVDR